jgi:hypothetical protein
MVNVVKLCSSSGREPSMREESPPKVTGWQRIMVEIITMAETLALIDVA